MTHIEAIKEQEFKVRILDERQKVLPLVSTLFMKFFIKEKGILAEMKQDYIDHLME